MAKKIIALLLATSLCLCALTACKKQTQGEQSTKAGTTAAQSDAGTTKKSSADADSKDTANGESSNGGTTAADAKQTTTQKGADSKTGGWEQQKSGELVKGKVRVNVAKYAGTALSDGEELIEQLISGGMKGAKVLASDTTGNTVVYKVSGTITGEKAASYVKFQFVPKGGMGYLVTVIAASQADMDTDISYVLDHLAELAV